MSVRDTARMVQQLLVQCRRVSSIRFGGGSFASEVESKWYVRFLTSIPHVWFAHPASFPVEGRQLAGREGFEFA